MSTKTVEINHLYPQEALLHSYPDEQFPLSSDATHSAYQFFWEKYKIDSIEGPRRTEDRLTKINTLLGSFCGDGGKAVYAPTYEAATLSYINRIYSTGSIPDGARNSQRALKMASQELSGEKGEDYTRYTFGLLYDINKIDDTWQNDQAEKRDSSEIFDYNKLSDLFDLDKMLDLAENTNIESILIKASETAVDLADYTDNESTSITKSQAENFVKMSESLLAPLLEIMGYDGFAMHMNSVTKRIRLKELGEKGQFALSAAEEILKDYNNASFGTAIATLLNNSFGAENYSIEPLFNDEASIAMYHGICITEGGDSSYTTFRRKTRGSLAWKMYQDIVNGKIEIPVNGQSLDIESYRTTMDIIAGQIVFDELNANSADSQFDGEPNDIQIAKLAKTFSKTLSVIESGNTTELKPSPSRDSAVHIRGKEKFIANVASQVYLNGYHGSIDGRKEQPGGMEVAKLTFTEYIESNSKPLKFELQFLTEQQRKAMRTGKIAHIFYKLGITDPTDEQIAKVQRINERKDSVKEPTLIDDGVKARGYLKNIKSVDSFDMGVRTLKPFVRI